jgi:AraC-like DNA-binding protein
MEIIALYMDNVAKNMGDSLFPGKTDIIGVEIASSGACFNKKNYHCKGRIRDDYMLLCTTAGEAWVKENGRMGKLIKGSWFFLRSGLEHAYKDISTWSFIYIHFSGASVERTLSALSFAQPENLGFFQSGTKARKTLEEIIKASADISISGEIFRETMLLRLLAELHSEYEKDEDFDSSIKKGLEFIEDNANSFFSLDETAEAAGISKYHFSRLFKQRTGLSPIRYAMKIRIEKAKKRLALSDKKIGEIASSLGFEDSLYFSRTFKKWTGLSPLAFRDSAQKDFS